MLEEDFPLPCKLIKPRKQVEMIRQLKTPETGQDKGPPHTMHTNTHSQGPLPSNRDHVTNTWLSYTNKQRNIAAPD